MSAGKKAHLVQLVNILSGQHWVCKHVSHWSAVTAKAHHLLRGLLFVPQRIVNSGLRNFRSSAGYSTERAAQLSPFFSSLSPPFFLHTASKLIFKCLVVTLTPGTVCLMPGSTVHRLWQFGSLRHSIRETKGNWICRIWCDFSLWHGLTYLCQLTCSFDLFASTFQSHELFLSL